MNNILFIIKSICLLILFFSCDSNIVVGEIGLYSDLDGYFLPYVNGKLGPAPNTSRPSEGKFTKGTHTYYEYMGGLDYQRDGDPINDLFNLSSIFNMDSIVFLTSDSTYKLVYIRPELDDSVNYEFSKASHIWNRVNWYYVDNVNDFIFVIREDDFLEFGIKL